MQLEEHIGICVEARSRLHACVIVTVKKTVRLCVSRES